MMRKGLVELFAISVLAGCGPAPTPDGPDAATAPVRAPLVQMPFAKGTSHLCPQGVESDREHTGAGRFGVDLAARFVGEDVLAPVTGTAYVHTDGRHGRHVNIDVGGRYVTVGFLRAAYATDGDTVVVGEVIGRAGVPHGRGGGVHLALYRGDASAPAGNGTPLPLARLMTRDRSMGKSFAEYAGEELICGGAGDPIVGHHYESATIGVLRHPPGTLIRSADDPDVYLIRANFTKARIADSAVFRASGYADAQIVIVSGEEMDCYDEAKEITRSVPAPAPPRLRDGKLVKEIGLPASYVVSGGSAWPIRYWEVFLLAGYDPAQVTEIPAGTLAGRVEAIGDCERADRCLDAEFLSVCAHAVRDIPEETDAGTPPDVREPDRPAPVPTAPDPPPAPPAPPPRSPPDAGPGAAPDALDRDAYGVQDAARGSSSPNSDTWVWRGEGARLCLHARYFFPMGASRATLHIWSGPIVTGTTGPVAQKEDGRFCWDFSERPPGAYRFWSDVAHPDCALDDWCRSDGKGGNGALYYEAPMASPEERKWLACQDTGCDGAARWDGSRWDPAGNR